MQGQDSLTRQKAERLFRKHRQVTLPGSGVLHFQGQHNVNQDQYIRAVECEAEALLQNQILTRLDKNLHIAMRIPQVYCKRIQIFEDYFNGQLLKLLKSNPERQFILTLTYSRQRGQQLVKIVRFIQIRELPMFIEVLLPQSISQYQQSLALMSFDLLENQMVLLQAISLIIKLPTFDLDSDTNKKLLMLLSIWKRTLPVSLEIGVKAIRKSSSDYISQKEYGLYGKSSFQQRMNTGERCQGVSAWEQTERGRVCYVDVR